MNEQTRRRINQVSNRIGVQRLVTINAGFDREQLEPDAMHYINLQKPGTEVDGVKATGSFAQSAAAILRVGMRTTTLETDSELVTPVREYEIEASEADLDRQFAEAGQRLGNGLHQTGGTPHGDRDALDGHPAGPQSGRHGRAGGQGRVRFDGRRPG